MRGALSSSATVELGSHSVRPLACRRVNLDPSRCSSVRVLYYLDWELVSSWKKLLGFGSIRHKPYLLEHAGFEFYHGLDDLVLMYKRSDSTAALNKHCSSEFCEVIVQSVRTEAGSRVQQFKLHEADEWQACDRSVGQYCLPARHGTVAGLYSKDDLRLGVRPVPLAMARLRLPQILSEAKLLHDADSGMCQRVASAAALEAVHATASSPPGWTGLGTSKAAQRASMQRASSRGRTGMATVSSTTRRLRPLPPQLVRLRTGPSRRAAWQNVCRVMTPRARPVRSTRP